MQNTSIGQEIPEPASLVEIINLGIEKPMLAINAIYEVLEQL